MMEGQQNKSRIVNILIVDDMTSNLIELTEIVRLAGYIARPVISAKQAMTAIKICLPDLILLDISMPDMDGFEFAEILKKDIRTKEIPIIYISEIASVEDKIRGFQLGAVDFLSKPFILEEITLRIHGHIKISQMQQELEIYNRKLHKMIQDQLYKISEEKKNVVYALTKLVKLNNKQQSTYIGYNCRIVAVAMQLTNQFEEEISNTFIELIELAAPLYNIGKIGMGREEKEHAAAGEIYLEEVYKYTRNNDYLKMASLIAGNHHEQWNGCGYPKGLKGKEIPLPARILSVVKDFLYFTQEASVQEKKEQLEYASSKIKEQIDIKYDPDIVELLLKVKKQLKY